MYPSVQAFNDKPVISRLQLNNTRLLLGLYRSKVNAAPPPQLALVPMSGSGIRARRVLSSMRRWFRILPIKLLITSAARRCLSATCRSASEARAASSRIFRKSIRDSYNGSSSLLGIDSSNTRKPSSLTMLALMLTQQVRNWHCCQRSKYPNVSSSVSRSSQEACEHVILQTRLLCAA